VWRANDAGEPSGSAGVPILGALDAAEVTDAVVVVTRWFGGTKLGVGGLVRAYGEAAALALDAAPRRLGLPARHIVIRYPYAHTAAVMRALEAAGAAEIEHGYSAAINGGETHACIPFAGLEDFVERVREQTAGEVVPELLESRVLYRRVPSTGGPDSA
jgi:putative IMPACT (imprinted ancient) family translation regulator